MKENRKWAKYFKVKEELSLKEVLSQNLISEENYLKWACLEYQLPRLRSDYFDSHRFEDLDKFKGVMEWDSTLVPLAEWEGYLYVGCLEPHIQPSNQKVVFVLAQLKNLKSVWKEYNSIMSSSGEAQKDLSIKVHQQKKSSEIKNSEDFQKNLKEKSSVDLEKVPLLKLSQPKEEVKEISESKSSTEVQESSKDEGEAPLKLSQPKEEVKEISESKPSTEVQESSKDESEAPLKLSQPKEEVKETSESKSSTEVKKDNVVSLNLKKEEEKNKEAQASDQKSYQETEKPSQDKSQSQDHFNDDFFIEEKAGGFLEKVSALAIRLFISTPKSKEKKKILEKKNIQKKSKKEKEIKKELRSKVENLQEKESQPEKSISKTESINVLELKQKSIPLKAEEEKIDSKEQVLEPSSKENAEENSIEIFEDTDTQQSSVEIVLKKGRLQPSIQFNKSEDSSTEESELEEPLQFNPIDTQTKVVSAGGSQSPIRSILEESKKHVCSYVLFRYLNNKFIPIKWSHNLKPKKNKPILLNKASFFRVSYHSKQSYFGFVPPVRGNQGFFENWNFTSLPEQIAFIPILSEDRLKVLGGYLGVLKDTDSSLEYLQEVESSVQPLEDYFQNKKDEQKLAA